MKIPRNEQKPLANTCAPQIAMFSCVILHWQWGHNLSLRRIWSRKEPLETVIIAAMNRLIRFARHHTTVFILPGVVLPYLEHEGFLSCLCLCDIRTKWCTSLSAGSFNRATTFSTKSSTLPCSSFSFETLALIAGCKHIVFQVLVRLTNLYVIALVRTLHHVQV